MATRPAAEGGHEGRVPGPDRYDQDEDRGQGQERAQRGVRGKRRAVAEEGTVSGMARSRRCDAQVDAHAEAELGDQEDRHGQAGLSRPNRQNAVR